MARLNSTTDFPVVTPAPSDRINGTDVSDTSNSADGQSVQFTAESLSGVYSAVQDTSTGLGEYNFTGIPSGVNHIDVILDNVQLASSSGIRVRAMVAGADVSTGYTSGSNGSPATNGFLLDRNNGSDEVIAIMSLYRLPGTNTWISSHSGIRTTGGSAINGAGRIALAGEIDGIQIHADGSTFSAGQAAIRYRF